MRVLKSLHVLIVTEGGTDFGYGHLTRCLSLAEACEEAGMEVSFAVRGDESVEEVIGGYEFEIYNWLVEKARLLQELKQSDVMILDSYHAPEEFVREMGAIVGVPVFMDDTNRIHYPPGIVVNWSISASELNYPEDSRIVYLLGPRYISLREAFRDAEKRDVKKEIGSVLITFGGDDSKHMTYPVLKFLIEKYGDWEKRVIIGRAFHGKDIKDICELGDAKTVFIDSPDGETMSDVMSRSDIAICSGGQTVVELACIGVPAVVISVADNQVNNVKGWEKTGFIEYAGHYDAPDLISELERKLIIMEDRDRRKKSAEAGREAVPGNGVERIVKAIEDYK